MNQNFDQTIDDIYKRVKDTKKRVLSADEHIKQLGEGAQKVGLSIDGTMLELNALMKDLFLCSQHQLPEYELLRHTLLTHVKNICAIVDSQFGKVKQPDKEVH